MMKELIEESWLEQLNEEFSKPYMQNLERFLDQETLSGQVYYPPKQLIFYALAKTPFPKTKVVIVGQDPYHGPNQAHGLSFSVAPSVPMPPSLKNIFKEMESDLGIKIPNHGCLGYWAEQGVLMLNATLTVRARSPKSHYGQGWEQFTDAIVDSLIRRKDPLVFVLWGKSAQEKCQRVLEDKSTHHVVLTAPHPSPYSAHSGFFGCKHFSKVNQYLKGWEKEPIDWQLKTFHPQSSEKESQQLENRALV